MKRLLIVFFLSMPIWAADNEIYIDQTSGTSNSNFDLEQLGSGNMIGGADSATGNMTGLILNGTGMPLDINRLYKIIFR